MREPLKALIAQMRWSGMERVLDEELDLAERQGTPVPEVLFRLLSAEDAARREKSLAYRLAPRSIVHSWVEVWFEGAWIPLEGFILDDAYLRALQQRFATHRGAFCGYGAATPDLHDPGVEWRGLPTYIQKDGINHDYGVYDDPDTFYSRHGVNLSGMKAWLFKTVVRQQMNRNVARIRGALTVRSAAAAPSLCCADLSGRLGPSCAENARRQ